MFNQLIFSLIIATTTVFSYSNINLSVGTYCSNTFEEAAQYSISYQQIKKSQLGISVGLEAVQSSLNLTDMTKISVPLTVFQQFKLNRLPLKLLIGAGFSINKVPSTFGDLYIGSHLTAGLSYLIGMGNYINLSYKHDYGKTLNNGAGYSFDGSVIAIGVGASFGSPGRKERSIKTKPTTSQLNKQPPSSTQRRQSPSRGPRSNQSDAAKAYQQAQKMMSEMSWPTY